MMTTSMTAFSRQQTGQDWGTLTWEIRSLNHRYLETSVRLPENLRGLETSVRQAVRNKLGRGKIECQLHFQSSAIVGSEITINNALLEQLVAANRRIQKQLGEPPSIDSMELLRWPGVIAEAQLDTDALAAAALALLQTTLDELVASRQQEGLKLAELVQQRLDAMRQIVGEVRHGMPAILASRRQALLSGLEQLQTELEPARLEQEVVLLVQKADVDEELDRLNAHLDEVARVLQSPGQKGRRLDFLMQELNREANTLSAKSIMVTTTRAAVELKVLIEQMREQIQNIE